MCCIYLGVICVWPSLSPSYVKYDAAYIFLAYNFFYFYFILNLLSEPNVFVYVPLHSLSLRTSTHIVDKDKKSPWSREHETEPNNIHRIDDGLMPIYQQISSRPYKIQ